MYGVVVCPSCRKARLFEAGRKTTTCAHCNSRLRLTDLRVHHRSGSLAEAQHAAGVLNAVHSGQDVGTYSDAVADAAPRARRHEDAADRAAARARTTNGEKAQVDAIARALSLDGSWSEPELEVALERAGLPPTRVEAHLARMLATHVVYEPTPGRYLAL